MPRQMDMPTVLLLAFALFVVAQVTDARHAVGHAPVEKDKCCLKMNGERPYCCSGFAGPFCGDNPAANCGLDCSDLCNTGVDECCPEDAPYCCAGVAGNHCLDFPDCTPGDCSEFCTPQDECCAELDEDKPYCCAMTASSECVDFPGCPIGDCSDQCSKRPPDKCCVKLNEEKPFCCAGFASNLCVEDPFCTPADDCSDLCEDPCQQQPGVAGPCRATT